MQEVSRSINAPDGAVIAYRITRGERPRRLLILIHGMASNMTRWSEFVETTTLADSWDLLRLDLRGHGRSLFRGRIDLETWCSDLAAMLDAEGYAKAVLTGHCLGANLAVRFAGLYPEKTEGLILIEPLLRQALTGAMKRFQPIKPLFLLLIGAILFLNRFGLYRRRIPELDLRELDRRTRAVMSAEGSSQALLRRYAVPWHDLRYMPSADYFQEYIQVSRPYPPLSGITVPVLALLSTGRFLSDPRVTRAVLSELPDCRVITLESQHWIPTEKPEEMRRAIEHWCGEIERA